MSDKKDERPEFYIADSVKPEEEASLEDILKRKTGIMVCIPNMGSQISTPLVHFIASLSFKTIDLECPWFFKVSMPNDLSPVEYARNQCVKEFLKDPFYKRMWFIDADMAPPGNALDLLTHDEDMVSAMTYIWTGERLDSDGFYKPPVMKINAFMWRSETQDFISMIPKPTGDVFYCDAAGCASLIIKKEVFLDVPEPWFKVPRDPYGAALRSEDLEFTRAATSRGHKLLYTPKVQFGHIKTVDLRQVLNYGLASMRGMVEKVKTLVDDKTAKELPTIVFNGERPAPAKNVPKTFEVLRGANIR